MSDERVVTTSYGFIWRTTKGKGWLRVIRYASFRDGYKVVRIDGGDPENGIDVYVSPGGRSVRAFRDGKELT